MPHDPDLLAAAIGGRIRTSRLAAGLTLDQLAERSGVSRRMVVNVEQGATNPSIATLLRLSEPLGVGLPELVAPSRESLATITRAGEGATLWSGEAGGAGVLVAGTSGPDVVELWEWRLAPGERHASAAHSAGTRELLVVRAGGLAVEVGGERHELGEGDAIAFAGDADHAYESLDGAEAAFTLTVFEPGAGAGRGGTSTKASTKAARA